MPEGGTPPVVSAVFRSYSEGDALRSDRSARDRQRHRLKVRKAIRENIAEVVAEEAIISQRRDKIVKVPIRGIKEYRFVYGDQTPGVGTGTGDTQAGQVVGQVDKARGAGPAGDQRGVDYYETEVTAQRLIGMMFEDVRIPRMAP